MTKIEALELELAARKMVEGTELYWGKALRCEGVSQTTFKFDRPIGGYELALGIIEGRPCWVGDTAYWTDNRGETHQIIVGRLNSFNCPGWSWNPPALKTVGDELWGLLREYVQAEATYQVRRNADGPGATTTKRLAEQVTRTETAAREACRKALENLK